jgi:hypothetical protein
MQRTLRQICSSNNVRRSRMRRGVRGGGGRGEEKYDKSM